jgi:hypothetical protein
MWALIIIAWFSASTSTGAAQIGPYPSTPLTTFSSLTLCNSAIATIEAGSIYAAHPHTLNLFCVETM